MSVQPTSTTATKILYLYEQTFGARSELTGPAGRNLYTDDGKPGRPMEAFIGWVERFDAELRALPGADTFPRICLVNAEIHPGSDDEHADSAHRYLINHALTEEPLPVTTVSTREQTDSFRDKFAASGFILFLGGLEALRLRNWSKNEDVSETDNEEGVSETDGEDTTPGNGGMEYLTAFQALRAAQFYVETCVSAGIGQYVHCDVSALRDGNEKGGEGRIIAPDGRLNVEVVPLPLRPLFETVHRVISAGSGVPIRERRRTLFSHVHRLFMIAQQANHRYDHLVDNTPASQDQLWHCQPKKPLGAPLVKDIEPGVETSHLYGFVRQLAALHMLGKGNNQYTEREVIRIVPWLEGNGGIYSLKRLRDDAIQDEGFSTAKGERLLRWLKIERRFEVYRDLGRCLERGVGFWAEEHFKNAGRPLQLLMVDDIVCGVEPKSELGEVRRRFISQVQRAADIMGGKVSLKALKVTRWSEVEDWLDGKRHPLVAEIPLDGNEPDWESIWEPKAVDIIAFDFILMDISFRTSTMGPYAVRRVADCLDRRARKERLRNSEKASPAVPRIVVLTREQNVQFVDLCLDLGADIYLDKRRIYQLPARLRDLSVAKKSPSEPGGVAGFRVLEQLLPANRAKLESHQPSLLVEPNELGSRNWVRNLPKADLHFHMGTSIRLETIQALAFNTAGYLARNIYYEESVAQPGQVDGPPSRSTRYRLENERVMNQAVIPVCGLIARAMAYTALNPGITFRAAILQCALDDPVVNRGRPKKRSEITALNLWDELFDRFAQQDLQVHQHEIAGLIVALISWLSHTLAAHGSFNAPPNADVLKAIRGRWDYAKDVSEWLDGESESPGSGLRKYLRESLREVFPRAAKSIPLTNYSGAPSLVGVDTTSDDHIFSRVQRRFNAAVEMISQGFQQALKDVREASSGFADVLDCDSPGFWETDWAARLDFKGLVQIDESSSDGSLSKYLEGAGLLGAEHLQYPENVLLAARDIVEQNVADRIIYSEVRCETTGYCAAGMTAQNATNLLCLAFDVATVYGVFAAPTAEERSLLVEHAARDLTRDRRWVRINVLLGAKRHKSAEKIRHIVSLLENNLERGSITHWLLEQSDGETESVMPTWWSPSCVVGFDLSGDEKGQQHSLDELAGYVAPLFRKASPITIHAGEAASAESIWQAVFVLGARRIGHGLRLREQPNLLSYCVTRKICMELCPISNRYTNGYIPISPHERTKFKPGFRYVYPLRTYMDAGMDVCINTDNRSLHQHGTLTDEFLAAAGMVGGLTRGEVLKLIRASLKSAFLTEEDVSSMLDFVESELYRDLVESSDAAPYRPEPALKRLRKRDAKHPTS